MTGVRSRKVETLGHRCALGLRPLDAATGHGVTGPLRSGAWLAERPGTPLRAVVGPSGLISFHGIPGLRAYENVDLATASGPATSPGGVRVAVEIRDPARRFLPVALILTAPADPLPVDVPLFAGAGYTPAAGWGELRGRLADAGALESPPRRLPGGELEIPPARHALVTVSLEGDRIGAGLADWRGEVVVPFPLPEPPLPPPRTSPPISPAERETPEWELEVVVSYAGSLPPVPGSDLPDLAAILDQVPAVLLPHGPGVLQSPPLRAIRVRVRPGRPTRLVDPHEPALWLHS